MQLQQPYGVAMYEGKLYVADSKGPGLMIFDLKESGDVGAIAVLSLTMVAITTVVVAGASRLQGRAQTRPM